MNAPMPEVPENAQAIPLRNADGTVRAWMLVDDDDAEWVNKRKWCVATHGYVRCNAGAFHRMLLGVTDPKLDVDHINRNRLDNRRSNLRIVTRAQNRQNTPAKSGKRGVHFCKKRQKWVAQHTLNYKNHHIGRFDSEEEADRAAIAWRKVNMPYAHD